MSARRAILAAILAALITTACATGDAYPDGLSCGRRSPALLMTQAIPTSDAVPCLDDLPDGFTQSDATIRAGHVSVTLLSDRHGTAATLIFEDACRSGADAVTLREGGCVSWDFAADIDDQVRQELEALVLWTTRAEIQADVRAGFIEDAEL